MIVTGACHDHDHVPGPFQSPHMRRDILLRRVTLNTQLTSISSTHSALNVTIATCGNLHLQPSRLHSLVILTDGGVHQVNSDVTCLTDILFLGSDHFLWQLTRHILKLPLHHHRLFQVVDSSTLGPLFRSCFPF